MSTPLVSVIMPVYNAGSYLSPAIESVLNQNFRDFELILVDDGATDGSGLLCDEFAKNDTRVRVIHQNNGGISKARNTALDKAKGKYITFCDHDDFYEPQYLEVAVSRMEATNADLGKFVYRSEYWEIESECFMVLCQKLPDENFSINQIYEDADFFDCVVRALWNGIYRREIIEKFHIRFNESVRFGMEDFLFNFHVVKNVKTISTMSQCLFVHYIRKWQSTDRKYNANKLESIILSAEKEAELLQNQKTGKEFVMKRRNMYLIKYINMLLHEKCPLTLKEKAQKMKKIRKLEAFEPVVCWGTVLKNPKQYLCMVLYKFNLHYLLLLLKEMHQRNKLKRVA